MKVTLYMATSLNGFIARDNDDTSFVSDEDWKSFRKITKDVGNIVIGRKTYEIMKEENEFEKLEDINVYVLTHKKLKDDNPKIKFLSENPQEVLNIIENDGFERILISGGGRLNSSFMKNNLVDEIFIDIEPFILGKGIKLFSEDDFETKLDLVDVKKLSDKTVQLHYQVKK